MAHAPSSQLKGADGAASQIICRIRPCDKPSPLVSVSEEDARIEGIPEKGHPGEPLQFHHVLNSRGPGEQEALFEYIRPSVQASVRGSSCTILAYGGSQSGKSYALAGFFTHTRLHGLAPRAIQLISEMRENDPEGMPMVEASFFELQNDCICDLVPRDCPRVLVKESSQPPYVLLDERLAASRCDGSNGYSRLLDTYFTGIEHKRKNAHTCFQLCFVNGEVRSYLRFVEMAWPRSQSMPGAIGGTNASSASTKSLHQGNEKSSTPTAPPQGRACAALEQVLQCKLSNTMPVPYRSSPLALLLKPCFEGTSLLSFIYCMRLEHTHLPCLTLAAPLLTKLHQWMQLGREIQSKVARGRARVPPLQLHATCQGSSVQAPPGKPAIGADMSADSSAVSVDSSSDSESPQHSPSNTGGGNTNGAGPPGPCQVAQVVQAQQSVQQAVQPLNMALPLQGMEASSEPSTCKMQEARMMQDCSLMVQCMRQESETRRQNVMRKAALLDNVASNLDRLRANREAGQDTGPSEKETTLKLLYEQVSRSLQRTNEEMTKLYDDIEVFTQFCEAGSFQPAYDSYNATEQDVQKLMDYAASQANASEALPGHQQSLDPGASASHNAGAGAAHTGPRADGVVVIPQLRLGLLPQSQEVPMPQQQFAHAGGTSANMDDSRDQLSPSSVSSCSDVNLSQSMPIQNTTPATPVTGMPPLTLGVGPSTGGSPIGVAPRWISESPLGVKHRQLSEPVPVAPVISLPHTPPVPGGHRQVVGTTLAWQGASLSGFHVWPTAPQQTPVVQSLDEAGETVALEGVSSSQTSSYVSLQPPPVVVPPQSPELGRSASAWQLPTRATIQQLPTETDGFDGQGMRKSASTSNVQRALGVTPFAGGPNARPPVAVAAATVPPQAYSSPLPGHRATLGVASPMRSSSQSTLPTAGNSVNLSSASNSVPQMMVTKQGSSAALSRAGPPRPNVGRQATPGPQAVKSEEVRVRGSQGRTTHSPSPVMLRRSISTQAMRVDRSGAGSKPHGMAKQPSPERQRPPPTATSTPTGVVGSASPMRANWNDAPRRPH